MASKKDDGDVIMCGRSRSESFVDELIEEEGSTSLLQEVADKYLEEHEKDLGVDDSPGRTSLPKKTLEIVTQIGNYHEKSPGKSDSTSDRKKMNSNMDTVDSIAKHNANALMGDPPEAPDDKTSKKKQTATKASPKDQAKKDFDYHVKILLLGDSGVGKTSLMTRFADDEFHPNLLSTAGVDFRVRYLKDSDKNSKKRIKCQIWDTAGQERFHVVTRAYYRDADGIVLVYDASNEQSFDQISYWMNSIKDHAGDDIQIALLGNKIDLEDRAITYDRGLEVAEKYNALFYETSAKDGTNVISAFEALSHYAIINSKDRKKILNSGATSSENAGVALPDDDVKKRRCCIQ